MEDDRYEQIIALGGNRHLSVQKLGCIVKFCKAQEIVTLGENKTFGSFQCEG